LKVVEDSVILTSDISNMRILGWFSGDNSGASQSESYAQSENSEMYVSCLKMRLLMICAGDAAGFSSFERVLTFCESI